MNANPATPKRRWSFSLRTLFVLVTLLCVWLAYHANWIRQREKTLMCAEYAYFVRVKVVDGQAPLSIRVLGGRGVAKFQFVSNGWGEGSQHLQIEREEQERWFRERIASYFPESTVEHVSDGDYF